jgi:hypothetical protein
MKQGRFFCCDLPLRITAMAAENAFWGFTVHTHNQCWLKAYRASHHSGVFSVKWLSLAHHFLKWAARKQKAQVPG